MFDILYVHYLCFLGNMKMNVLVESWFLWAISKNLYTKKIISQKNHQTNCKANTILKNDLN